MLQRGINTQRRLHSVGYLHNIKLKIMLNVYEVVFGILTLIFFYLFEWEMRHSHTGGSCPVFSRQDV